jgi:K(+)-stimulated pyrophosphate-energized sodium pump
MTNVAVTFSAPLGLLGLVVAALIYVYLKRQPVGNELMAELGSQIREGARTFLKREYSVLIPFIIVVAFLLYVALGSLATSAAYIGGALCSLLAGFFGMNAATEANVRTSEAARDGGQGKALRIAFNGGAVMGLSVGSLGLLGIGVVLFAYSGGLTDDSSFKMFSEVIAGFAMGASSIALFARVGGGIYTKAADVGADLVGKVEAGIPEDDPRNPATIADNVGDNVGRLDNRYHRDRCDVRTGHVRAASRGDHSADPLCDVRVDSQRHRDLLHEVDGEAEPRGGPPE